VLFGRFRILLGEGFHALFGDAEMGCGARIGKFLAGPSRTFPVSCLARLEFLLVEESHGLFVDFHLGLHARVNHLDATTLRGRGLGKLFFSLS